MADFMQKLKYYRDRIDNFSLRERFAIMLGVLVVLYAGWDTFLMQPLQTGQKLLVAELQQKQAAQMALNIETQKTIADNRKDPVPAAELKLAALKEELKAAEEKMTAATTDLVSPKDMAKILETVLNKTGGLRLIKVKSLGANALVPADEAGEKSGANNKPADASEKPAAANAWLHGLRIEFEGDYMTTLAYLRELEAMRWRFFWDKFELKIEEYPRARAAIEVYTLSLDKDWIGV